KLNAIELDSKYYVKYLRIEELAEGISGMRKFTNNLLPYNVYGHEQLIKFIPGSSCTDFLRRISQNVTLGRLAISVCGSYLLLWFRT
ncbi:hypothetical protein PMAYCL1PPCAC_27972, partial [Pristionchus mayeri]